MNYKIENHNVAEGIGSNSDEPPPDNPPLCISWWKRVGYGIQKIAGVRERRSESVSYTCVYRKHCFTMGTVELYRNK